MKRWNGWGSTDVNYPLKAEGLHFLKERIGAGNPAPDAELSQVIKTVPGSRLKAHQLIVTEPEIRLRHSVGQSLPDWITMRSGQYPAVVDGVAFPESDEDVSALIQYGQETGTHLIPYGGGTSVVGHLTPLSDEAPVLSIAMERMNGLLHFDETSLLATFQAGIIGPDLEARLRARGYTLGHFPQSFEFSTPGGWVATRSSGQQSHHYGRIEDLFAGGHIETPSGSLHLPAFPASAAGPDLRELVLGSEGRMGIITRTTLRVSPIPEKETFIGIFFPDFVSGVAAVQSIVKSHLPVAMMRLSNPVETETTLMLSGSSAIKLLETYLRLRGVDEGKCLLIVGLTGNRRMVGATRRAVLAITRSKGGVLAGTPVGNGWRKNRFRGAYLRNTLWDHGYAVDTLETAVNWNQAVETMQDVEKAIQQTSEEKAHVFTHFSHMYPTGTSVYTTYVFRRGETPEATRQHWLKMKTAASQAIVANGGTISHQHGVGHDHKPYLEAEKGTIGIQSIDHSLQFFDPDRMMNPGKLV